MNDHEDFPVTITIAIESKADPKTGLREGADAVRARLLGEARSQAHTVGNAYAKLLGKGESEFVGLGRDGIVERDGKLTAQFVFRCARK